MSVTSIIGSPRPPWPGAEPSASSSWSLSCAWRVLAPVYVAIGLATAFLVRSTLGPVERTLRVLIEGRVRRGSAWPWAFAVGTTAGCLLVPAALGGARSPLGLGTWVVLSWLLLGAFRWSCLWLMERETNHETYEAMLARLDGPLTRWFTGKLRRPEDVLWLRHIAVSTLVHLPPTASVLVWGPTCWFAAAWYVVTIFGTVKTAGLNHNLGHYEPFRNLRGGRWARAVGRAITAWYHFGVELLEGDVPHLTIVGHNLIHHAENNGPADFESTYPYDRTSFVSTSLLYFNCMLSYSFGVGIVPYLAKRRTRPHRAGLRRACVGLACTYALLLAVALVCGPQVAAFFLCVRLLQSGLRYGPFAYVSHVFVDPDRPTDSFSNSLDFATRGTLTHGGCAHILHHHRPGRHWTTLRATRRDLAPEYERRASVVIPFEVVPYVQPLVFGKRFDVLSRWLLTPSQIVAYEDDPASTPWPPAEERADLARMLERRSRPPSWAPPGPLVRMVDDVAARLALWATGARALLEPTTAPANRCDV